MWVRGDRGGGTRFKIKLTEEQNSIHTPTTSTPPAFPQQGLYAKQIGGRERHR